MQGEPDQSMGRTGAASGEPRESSVPRERVLWHEQPSPSMCAYVHAFVCERVHTHVCVYCSREFGSVFMSAVPCYDLQGQAQLTAFYPHLMPSVLVLYREQSRCSADAPHTQNWLPKKCELYREGQPPVLLLFSPLYPHLS